VGQPAEAFSEPGDHHCPTARSATLLVTGTDEIVGTHRSPGNAEGDTVQLTDKGWSIYHKMLILGNLDAALSEYNQEAREKQAQLDLQRRREESRHRRCLEATDIQKIEFEHQFLLALHGAAKGGTSAVKLEVI
jgi:hypothetical protein